MLIQLLWKRPSSGQSFSQKFEKDYDETFCPVVRVWALIALSVQRDL